MLGSNPHRIDYQIYSDISWNMQKRHHPANGYGHGVVVVDMRTGADIRSTNYSLIPSNRPAKKVNTRILETRGMVASALQFLDEHDGDDTAWSVELCCDNQGSVLEFVALLEVTDAENAWYLRHRNNLDEKDIVRLRSAATAFHCTWVPGHSGVRWNQVADQLAREKRWTVERPHTRKTRGKRAELQVQEI